MLLPVVCCFVVAVFQGVVDGDFRRCIVNLGNARSVFQWLCWSSFASLKTIKGDHQTQGRARSDTSNIFIVSVPAGSGVIQTVSNVSKSDMVQSSQAFLARRLVLLQTEEIERIVTCDLRGPSNLLIRNAVFGHPSHRSGH